MREHLGNVTRSRPTSQSRALPPALIELETPHRVNARAVNVPLPLFRPAFQRFVSIGARGLAVLVVPE
jgi:hypothetical protein